jgi:NAD-dependent SIR2 family protein deacetylase
MNYSQNHYFIITQNDHGFFQKLKVPDKNIWELFGNLNYFQSTDGKIFHNKEFFFNVGPKGTIQENQVPKIKESTGSIFCLLLVHSWRYPS